MTNFEACGVLLCLRLELERQLQYEEQDKRQDGYCRERIQKLKNQVQALNKAGAALTKRG